MIPAVRPRRSGSRALLIVGHGSHLNPASSRPVYEHADRIRRMGLFDEVLEAFWKEEPSLRDALDLVASDEVFVVPLFLAEGYFTREVVPRELGIDGRVTNRAGQTVHYCPPVGVHPTMRDLVLTRARSMVAEMVDVRSDVALVLIGHGTERNATSSSTVVSLVDDLRRLGEFAVVECGFLDEHPRIADVVEQVPTAALVLVPFFVAEGWHTAETIPGDLGLDGVRTDRDGRTLWYAPPVGTLPEVAEVIVSSAADAGAFRPIVPGSVGVSRSRPAIADARAAFTEWIRDAGSEGRTLLEISIRATGRTFEIAHVDDAAVARARLRRLSDPASVLEVARTDAAGGYRPLRSERSLARGWVLAGLDLEALWTAISRIYPGAVLGWYLAGLARTGGPPLPVVSFAEWAARQSGIYDGLKRLDRDALASTIGRRCGSCARFRVWEYDASAPTSSPPPAAVPCVEPCTIFASAARETLSGVNGS